MTHARRVDANHGSIVKALRKIGCHVFDSSKLGRGFPDLVVQFGFRLVLVEVKAPGGKLTPEQEEFHRIWAKHCVVAESPEDAIKQVTR